MNISSTEMLSITENTDKSTNSPKCASLAEQLECLEKLTNDKIDFSDDILPALSNALGKHSASLVLANGAMAMSINKYYPVIGLHSSMFS